MTLAKRLFNDIRENTFLYLWLIVFICVILVGITSGQNPRLINGELLERYKSAMPTLEDPNAMEVIESDRTMWYNTQTMGVWYQAYRNEALRGTFSAFRNVDANRPPDPFGNGNREYPWAPTLGGGSFDIDYRQHLKTAKGILLPVVDGKQLPVVVYGSGPIRWVFPNGTKILEVAWRADSKYWRPIETRFRMREPNDWQTDRFDPVGTRDQLVESVAKTHPAIARQIVEGKVTKVTIEDAHPRRAIRSDATVQNLPDFPVELTNRILKQEQKSMAGVEYAPGIDRAVTKAVYHVRPKGDVTANHGSGERESCRQCHRDIGKHVRTNFERNRGWYGNIRGSDGIFSYYPHREFFNDGSAVRWTALPADLRNHYSRSVFAEAELRR